MVFEFVAFILIFAILYGIAVTGWIRKARGNKQREAMLNQMLGALRGRRIQEAAEQFGEPSEIVFGSSGARLYIWKQPAGPALPKGSGVVVITVNVDAADIVTGSSWKTLYAEGV